MADYLDTSSPAQAVIDLDVYLGAVQPPCRLGAYRLPEESVNRRRPQAYAPARKKGRTPGQAYLRRLAFGLDITTVSREVWAPEVVGTIYRVRWQMELTFKRWKSLTQIHLLKGTRPERIKCFSYGRLPAMVLLGKLSGYALWDAQHPLAREVSEHKLFSWLIRRGRIAKAVHQGRIQDLLHTLTRDLANWCKDKRKRKTPPHHLAEQTPELESFEPRTTTQNPEKHNKAA